MATLLLHADSASTAWTGQPLSGDGYYWYKDLLDDVPDIVLLDREWAYVPGVAFPVALSALFGWWQPVQPTTV